MKFIETLKKIYLFYVYEHACMYIVYHVYAVPLEARRAYRILYNWSCRQFWAIT